MTKELLEVLNACVKAFPEIRDAPIRIGYKKLKQGTLAQTRMKKVHEKGRAFWIPVIEVSCELRSLQEPQKTQLLKYVVTHELVHILRGHIMVKRSKGHEADFEREVSERLSRLR